MGRPRVRDKILSAAGELFDRHGITGITTRGVAAHAGVTEASVFNNFGDKSGLIQALLREQLTEFQLFSEALSAPVDQGLTTWIEGVFTAAHKYFRVVLPLAGPQLSRGRPASAAKTSDRYIGHSALSDRLTEMREQGLIRGSVNTDATALLLMGAAMHSALTTQTLGDDALGGSASLVQGVTATLATLMDPG